MTLTEQEAKRITQQLDVRTALPEQADLVFVFGTRHPEPAYLAANLIKRGTVDTAVLTGGRNRLTGAGEADTHLEILLSQRVPRARIIVENESTNTLENVTLALTKISARIGLQRIGSIIVVTKWYHCRRAMMTLKRHLPAEIRFFAVTYEPEGIGRSDWWESGAGSQRVLKERDRIPRYLLSGDIEEIREEDGGYV